MTDFNSTDVGDRRHGASDCPEALGSAGAGSPQPFCSGHGTKGFVAWCFTVRMMDSCDGLKTRQFSGGVCKEMRKEGHLLHFPIFLRGVNETC